MKSVTEEMVQDVLNHRMAMRRTVFGQTTAIDMRQELAQSELLVQSLFPENTELSENTECLNFQKLN